MSTADMKEILRRLVGFAPSVVLLCLYVYHIRVLWSMFAAGEFGFHDLTLITDWFTNAIYQGKPFYITDYETNHLSYNFTPSLLLLIPFYLVGGSQFMLIFLGISALYGAIYILLRTFRELALPAAGRGLTAFVGVALVVLCCQNVFTKLVLVSAHFEVLFALPAAWLTSQLLLRDDSSWIGLVACALFALGIRQDAGLYLAFILAGLVVVRPRRDRAFLIRVSVLIAICFVYMGVVIVGVMPALGYTDGLRFWKHLGHTPWEILQALASSPANTWQDLKFSGFLPLNRSFGYYHLFSPFTIFANLPVFPMYFVKTADFARKMLLLYNASFALVGFYIAVMFGLLVLLRLVRLFRGIKTMGTLGTGLLVMVLLSSLHSSYRNRDRLPYGSRAYTLRGENRLAKFHEFHGRLRRACPGPRTVATDFNTLTFLPHDTRKFVLSHYKKAEGVIVDMRSRPGTPNYREPAGYIAEIKRAGYREIVRVGEYRFLLSPNARCDSKSDP